MENLSEVKSQNSSEPKDEHASSLADRRLIGLLPMFILVLIIVLRISWTLYKSFGQKTRNPQQRRMYVGTRARPSLGHPEPSIYVSPSNLPPPPKYECMAPPSYEEVVGVHYPNYQPAQPITQPITVALAQNAQANTQANTSTDNETRSTPPRNDETVVTVSQPVTVSS